MSWSLDPFSAIGGPAPGHAGVPAAPPSVPSPEDPIRAWTDGAAKGNPGPAGWCWWVSDTCWEAGGWPSATNNVAELTAVHRLLQATAGHAHRPLHITTDSRYVLDALTKWVHGWRRNGWRTKAGTPVANQDLIQQIDTDLSGRDVVWTWTKGHALDIGNNAADLRCSNYADALRGGFSPDPGPGWTG